MKVLIIGEWARVAVLCLLSFLLVDARAYDMVIFDQDIEKARSMMISGKADEAIMYLESKRGEYGGNQGYFEYELGSLYFRVGRFADAEREYKRSLEMGGLDYRPALLGMALTLDSLKRFDEAAEYAEQVIERFPNWYAGYYAKASIDYGLGNNQTAREYIHKALEIEQGADSYYLLAGIAYELKDYRTVVSAMNSAVNMDKSYLGEREGMLRLVFSLTNLRGFDSALEALELYKSHNPDADAGEIGKIKKKIITVKNKKQ